MSETKKAAIDLDEIGEKSLGEISAADFLAALNAGGFSVRRLTGWSEKKKVERETEPGGFDPILVKDFINEKKKVEMEKQPGEDWSFQFEGGIFTGPYEQLLDRLTRDIEIRLRQRMNQ